MDNLHISLAAEPVFSFFSFSVTNSALVSIIILFLFLFLGIIIKKKNLSFNKPSRLQQMLEVPIEALYNLSKSIAGTKASEFFPIIATIFFFVLISNWSGLLPGFGTIGIYQNESKPQVVEPVQAFHIPANPEYGHEVEQGAHQKFTPLFRAPSADLNTTLALAVFSIISIQITGFKHLGLGYLKKFFNFSNPICFFVGILELIGEFAKIISFAFRLFGNIFAGEVLLIVTAALIPVIAPFPFYGLELFVGLIQALVFAMLTLVFLNLATISHHEH